MTFILKLSRDALSITYLTLHLPFLLKSRLEILWVQFALALLTPEELPARLSKMMLSKRYYLCHMYKQQIHFILLQPVLQISLDTYFMLVSGK